MPIDEATTCDILKIQGMLFCRPLKSEKLKEIFKIVDDFMKEKRIKWSDCVWACTAAAHLMAGNKDALSSLNCIVQEAMWTHCIIHCESLAIKELWPEFSEGMDTVIKTVNYIKSPPLKSDSCRIMQGNECPVSVNSVLL